MTTSIRYGGTPGLKEEPVTVRVSRELNFKMRDASEGKIKAFFSVDIQNDCKGKPVLTVTTVVDSVDIPEEAQDRFREHLWGIANLLKTYMEKKS